MDRRQNLRRAQPADDRRKVLLDAVGDGVGTGDDGVLERVRALTGALVGQARHGVGDDGLPAFGARGEELRHQRVGIAVHDQPWQAISLAMHQAHAVAGHGQPGAQRQGPRDAPLEERGVFLAQSPDGGVMVYVGLTKYMGIDEVPDAEIKAAIRAAIALWETKYTPGL